MAYAKVLKNICRVCLTSSQNLINLMTPMNERYNNFEEKVLVIEVLEIVVGQKVFLHSTQFPEKICQMCLSFLKIAYDFQVQFLNSQQKLEKSTGSTEKLKTISMDKTPKVIDESSKTAAVELIFGDSKFDFNNVLVIEDEKVDKSCFKGFLNNLGSEISATFVRTNVSLTEVESRAIQPIVSVTKYNNLNVLSQKSEPKKIQADEFNFDTINLSDLVVKKYPDESKIEIINKKTNTKIKTVYECGSCKKKFLGKSDLETHRHLKHSSRKYLVCEKCGHLLKTQSQLYHHMQKHKGKRFECVMCDKKYDSLSKLKTHEAVHKNERLFLCNVCGKNFNYSISLKYHMRLHADKKFVCNICGLKYRMPNTLKRHIRTHTKDKPYPCDYCHKKFSSRGEKLTHEMIHTGVRPYHCEYCGKGFIKSVNLKMHYLSHPGQHECDVCHKTFLEMKFLKVHVARMHKEYELIEVSEV